jgi:hypothetical protein
MGVARWAAALAWIVGLSAASVSSAMAAQVINHWGEGAVAAFEVCNEQPNGDLRCDDRFVFYGRAGTTRNGTAPAPRGPADLQLEHYAAFIHPDGSADEFVVEVGFAPVSGSYDTSRLTFARSDGATLDLYDIEPETGALTPNGRTATLGPFTWTAASPIYVFGNDGPFGFGLPRLYVDRCTTAIENAHERFTTARVTGTIDGTSVADYGPAYLPWPGTGPADALGAIFNNRFNVVQQDHGPAC